MKSQDREVSNRWYALRTAVWSREFDLAKRLVQGDPELLSIRNSLGETVLHYLAIENDQEGVAWLFQHGATLDVKSEFGTPMLFEVASLGHKEMLLWLMEHGVDVSVQNPDGRDFLAYLHELGKRDMVEFIKKVAPQFGWKL